MGVSGVRSLQAVYDSQVSNMLEDIAGRFGFRGRGYTTHGIHTDPSLWPPHDDRVYIVENHDTGDEDGHQPVLRYTPDSAQKFFDDGRPERYWDRSANCWRSKRWERFP